MAFRFSKNAGMAFRCVPAQFKHWGAHLTKPIDGANPKPTPHPTNLALFGHKITLYQFNQGAAGSPHTIAGWLKSEQGELSPLPPHFNHCW